MKKFIYFLGLSLGLLACDKMTDSYKEYIHNKGGGEIFYLTRPDSIVYLGGEYSALIRLWTYNAPNVKAVKIFWDNEKDSLIVPVSLHTGKDSIDIVVPGLEEKAYTFTVYLADDFGNRSISVSGSCSVVGDVFLSSLPVRKIDLIRYTPPDKSVIIHWAPAIDADYTEVDYKQNDGETATIQVPNGEETTTIPDVNPQLIMNYRSVFQLATGRMYKDATFTPIDMVGIQGDGVGWSTYGLHSSDGTFVYKWLNVHQTGGANKFAVTTDWRFNIACADASKLRVPDIAAGTSYTAPVMFWHYDYTSGYDSYSFDFRDIAGGAYFDITLDLHEMTVTYLRL
ncbi:MAG: DUF4998 domain-containing protein [Bacteroidales bacterium]|jgi:hypothetical protein|nr:DUF4998 domain-containing protein [Bacteroidales bacterium]